MLVLPHGFGNINDNLHISKRKYIVWVFHLSINVLLYACVNNMLYMFCLLHTQTRAKYQCGETFNFNGTPPDICPNHRWAKIVSYWKVQTRAKYQCGDTFDFNGTPPDNCPNHRWARLESTWPISKPQTTATYQCGDTFDFNGTPPDVCPYHGWATIVSTWP